MARKPNSENQTEISRFFKKIPTNSNNSLCSVDETTKKRKEPTVEISVQKSSKKNKNYTVQDISKESDNLIDKNVNNNQFKINSLNIFKFDGLPQDNENDNTNNKKSSINSIANENNNDTENIKKELIVTKTVSQNNNESINDNKHKSDTVSKNKNEENIENNASNILKTDLNQNSVKKQDLHKKFVQKLKYLKPPEKDQSISNIHTEVSSDNFEDIENLQKTTDDVSSNIKEKNKSDFKSIISKFSSAKNIKKKKSILTPLEQQYVEIKKQNPDMILIVEVGYKFRFFGNDAKVAHEVLNIFLIPGKMSIDDNDANDSLYSRFASASIPIHRLHIHLQRLIDRGYKVGVVRQLETAAIKASSDNKNTPFTRKLTDIYTKGTYIEEAIEATSSPDNYLLCVTENVNNDSDGTEKVEIGIIAVQLTTGDLLYDQFTDGFMRQELETRLMYLQPAEFLKVGDLSHLTSKIINQFSTSDINGRGHIRIEITQKINNKSTDNIINSFYKDNKSNSFNDNEKLLEKVNSLPSLVKVCLSAMINYLKQYKLEHVFDLIRFFNSFHSKARMVLNSNTLSSLEIFKNQSDGTEKGSLFWLMDHTLTKFGKRLLRKWVGRPLIDREELETRLSSVEEIRTKQSPLLSALKDLMARLPDLERGLIQIHYGRISRKNLFLTLRSLLTISNIALKFSHGDIYSLGFNSVLINNSLANLIPLNEELKQYLAEFSDSAAMAENEYDFFLNEEEKHKEILNYKTSIKIIEQDIMDHLVEVRKILNTPNLPYVSNSGVDFLIEVRNAKLSNVPKDWIKISGTKTLSRFHSPTVIRLLREREKTRELLAIECRSEYKLFLLKISENYAKLRDMVYSLSVIDCLLSLVVVSLQPGYTKAEYVDKPCIQVEQGRHPVVEQVLTDSYVPNDIDLIYSSLRCMIITGPNMGGKSSFVRQVALISIMGQIGSYIPAQKGKLGMLDGVYTRMGAYDNLMKGESTFMVELNECSEIMRNATENSLVILDEIGRGTGTVDGVAVASSVLDYFISEIRCTTLFITHYPIISSFAQKYSNTVGNFHMSFIEKEEQNGWKVITFLYRVAQGVSHRSYGLNVAKLANIPSDVIKLASEKSYELEQKMLKKETIKLVNIIKILIEDANLENSKINSYIDELLYNGFNL